MEDEIVYVKATNWQTGEVRYVRGRRSPTRCRVKCVVTHAQNGSVGQMSPEKVVTACRSPKKGKIQMSSGTDVKPDYDADEAEVEVCRLVNSLDD